MLAGLASATGFIRSKIGKQLKLRFVPTIEFFYDETQDEAQRIEDLLKKGEETTEQAVKGRRELLPTLVAAAAGALGVLFARSWERADGVYSAMLAKIYQSTGGYLGGLALIALDFPKFSDGRAFSTARLLRELIEDGNGASGAGRRARVRARPRRTACSRSRRSSTASYE